MNENTIEMYNETSQAIDKEVIYELRPETFKDSTAFLCPRIGRTCPLLLHLKATRQARRK